MLPCTSTSSGSLLLLRASKGCTIDNTDQKHPEDDPNADVPSHDYFAFSNTIDTNGTVEQCLEVVAVVHKGSPRRCGEQRMAW